MSFPKLTVPPETDFRTFKDSMQRWLNAAEPYWNGTKVISSTVINNYFNTFNIIMPEKYGAVGDWTTDDTVAIQAAFDAAWALADTYTLSFNWNSVVPVVFSPGKYYRVTDTIRITGVQAMMGMFYPTFATAPFIAMDPTVLAKDLFVVVDPGIGCSLTCVNMSFGLYNLGGYVFNLPATYEGSSQVIASAYFANNRFSTSGDGCLYWETAGDLDFSHNVVDGAQLGSMIRVKTGWELRIAFNEIYVMPYGLIVEDYASSITAVGNNFRNCHDGTCWAFLNGRNDWADIGTRQAYYAALEAGGTLYGGGKTTASLTGNTIDGDVTLPNDQAAVLIDGFGDCNITATGNIYNNVDSAYYDIQTGTAEVISYGEIFGANVTNKIYQVLGPTATTFKGDIHRASGTTAQRPSVLLAGNAGQWYNDTTVGNPVWWDGSAWKDQLVTNGDAHDHVGGDGAQIDHGGTGGLTDDDHSQYLYLAGRSGGQTAKGGTDSGDDLKLLSTNHATKGSVFVGGDAGTTNYSEFESDGTLVFYGTATTFDDLPPVPIIAARLGSSAPTLATFIGNIEQYTFDATNDYVIGSTEITHKYKEGTSFYPHIHWATNGSEGSDKAVKWQLELCVANADGSALFAYAFTAPTVTTSVDVTIPSGTADRSHIISNFADQVNGASLKIGAYIVWRLNRIASAGTAPAADPFALAIGFHIEQDTTGSRTETAK